MHNLGEKLDYLLGHLRYKFDQELSAENLGTMFGGYGSFLEPSSTQGRVKTSRSRGGGNGLMNFGDKGRREQLVGYQDKGRKGLAIALEIDQEGRMEKEIPSKFVPNKEKNPVMHNEHRDGNLEHHSESQRAPAESPRTILEMMTSFPVLGGHLLSPLPESILQLKRKEPLPGKGQVDYGEKGRGDLMPPVAAYSDEGRMGLAVVLGKEKDIEDNNLYMHPVDDHRDRTEEHPSGSLHTPTESPGTIFQIMTALHIPGGQLLSPLPDSLLHLKKRGTRQNPPLPGLSKCNILDRKASRSSILVELSGPHGRVKTSPVVGGGKGQVDSGELGRGDLMPPVAADEGRMGGMHPVDDHGDVTEKHPPGSLHTPTESPGTIFQIMTALHIPGGQLLSPLPDSLLHLKKREPRQKPPLPRSNQFHNPEAKTTEALDAPYHMTVQSSNADIVGIFGQYSKSKRKKNADQDDYRPSKKPNREGAIENLHPNLGMGGSHFQSVYPKESFRTSYLETNDAVAISSKKRKMCSDFENHRSSSPEKRWKHSSPFPRQKSLVSSLRGSSHFKGNLQHVPHQQDKIAFKHSLSNRVGRTEVAFGRGKSQNLLPSKNEQELQTQGRKVILKTINRGGSPTDAVEVTKECNIQNCLRPHSSNHPDASSLVRNPTATKVLEEATRLEKFANCLRNNGSELESIDLYFQAALKFLQVAFLLQPPSFENAQHDDASQSMEMYFKAARLCNFCAHNYEKFNQFAAAALAYKCVEVAHMKVAYYKHSNATKYHHELQTALQMAKTHGVLDKAELGKGTSSPRVARTNIIAAHHCQTVLRLMNYGLLHLWIGTSHLLSVILI